MKNLNRTLCAILFIITLSGCGSAHSAPAEVTASTTKRPAPKVAGTEAAASKAADTYVRRISTGDYAQAAQLVVPSQRGYITALAHQGDAMQTAVNDIKPKTTTVSGREATVVFVGKICRTPHRGVKKDCISNADPHSADPIFTVHLLKGEHGWEVTLPVPEASRRATLGSSATGSASSR